VKGVASVYYAAVVIDEALLPAAQARIVFWTAAVAVTVSILAHGASASALVRRLLER
jgi:NhaP-type Na+/H+ or K+/H+ antiporter